MAVAFTTTILKADGGNATGIKIPPEVIAALGKQKTPKVKVNVNGYTYRSSVAVMGGVFMVGFNAAHREASGIKAGDQVLVTLELDLEPRIVDIPGDLAAALSEKPGATAAFDSLSFTMRKEYVRQVESAKAQETRTRRIVGIVTKVSGS